MIMEHTTFDTAINQQLLTALEDLISIFRYVVESLSDSAGVENQDIEEFQTVKNAREVIAKATGNADLSSSAVRIPQEPVDAAEAISEAINTLPDYSHLLDDSQICDVAWVKTRLSSVLARLNEAAK